jgi:hypothetical protein
VNRFGLVVSAKSDDDSGKAIVSESNLLTLPYDEALERVADALGEPSADRPFEATVSSSDRGQREQIEGRNREFVTERNREWNPAPEFGGAIPDGNGDAGSAPGGQAPSGGSSSGYAPRDGSPNGNAPGGEASGSYEPGNGRENQHTGDSRDSRDSQPPSEERKGTDSPDANQPNANQHENESGNPNTEKPDSNQPANAAQTDMNVQAVDNAPSSCGERAEGNANDELAEGGSDGGHPEGDADGEPAEGGNLPAHDEHDEQPLISNQPGSDQNGGNSR